MTMLFYGVSNLYIEEFVYILNLAEYTSWRTIGIRMSNFGDKNIIVLNESP